MQHRNTTVGTKPTKCINAQYILKKRFTIICMDYTLMAAHRYHRAKESEFIDTVTHAILYSCLYATHQRDCAVLLLVVEEERTVRKPADKVIAPVLLDNPVLSHVDIIPITRLLYQFYCINRLRPLILSCCGFSPSETRYRSIHKNNPRNPARFHNTTKIKNNSSLIN